MTDVYQYRVYCNTEAAYVYVWGTTGPTVCPNNNTHSINTSLTAIVNTVSTNTVVASEDSKDGYFETSHIIMTIPSGTPGNIIPNDVSWPMNVLLWKTIITPTSDMIGDSISVVASPETTIGVLTSPIGIGATGAAVLNVSATVISNIWRGFRVNLFDGVNKNVLGRCTDVNKVNNTITVEIANTNGFAAGAYVQIGVFVIKEIFITDTAIIDIGTKGFKGKTINAGVKLRVLYTNNSGTAKTLRWRIEMYNLG
jgi:hypothetical protein